MIYQRTSNLLELGQAVRKQTIILLYGGRSAEREAPVLSAESAACGQLAIVSRQDFLY